MNSDFIVAVHAMVLLCHRGGTLSSEVLAENVCTNPVRIRRVMARLKKAGLVETREGRVEGGYLCPAGRQITLGEIGRALEVRFADYAWRSGDKEKNCLVASGMSDYMDILCAALNRQCGAYLDAVTLRDVEQFLIRRAGSQTNCG